MDKSENYKTFTITEDHLNLLQHIYFDLSEGRISVNSKRPYGDSMNIEKEMAKIIGLEVDACPECSYIDPEITQRMIKLHEEMLTVLEIGSRTLKFEVGNYRTSDIYSVDWYRLEE